MSFIEYSYIQTRVARWYIVKPKIPIRVNFGGSCTGLCWYIIGRLVYFTAIRHILRPFCIIYGHLVYFSHFCIMY
jgi:hypothetical protein